MLKYQLAYNNKSVTVVKDSTGYYICDTQVDKHTFELALNILEEHTEVSKKVNSILDLLNEYVEEKRNSQSKNARKDAFWKEFNELCIKYKDVIGEIL